MKRYEAVPFSSENAAFDDLALLQNWASASSSESAVGHVQTRRERTRWAFDFRSVRRLQSKGRWDI